MGAAVPRSYEFAASGIDDALQGINGDAFNNPNAVGLRVPALAPTITNGVAGSVPDPTNRYLFLLAANTIAPNQAVRLRGMRTLVTIGQNLGGATVNVPVELLVTTPRFKFPDGNVSFHLMHITTATSMLIGGTPPTTGIQNAAFRWSDTPALLFETIGFGLGPYGPGIIYPTLSSYTPPNKGRPYGVPLLSSFGAFYDPTLFPWAGQRAWDSLDLYIPKQGVPHTVALFASVLQTNPSTRPGLTTPTAPAATGGPPEWQFIVNWAPNAIYWAVGGSLIFEDCD